MATTYDVWINGVSMTTEQYAVDTFKGRRIVPQRSNVVHEFAGMNGTSPAMGSFQASEFSIEMWVLGGPIGSAPTTAKFERNLDTILSLLTPKSTVQVMWLHPDGTYRRCNAIVTAAVVPEINHLTCYARVVIAFSNPKCFWFGDQETQTFRSFGTTQRVKVVESSTAPIDDVAFAINGPANGPRISSGPSWVQYNGSVPAGQTLTISNRAVTADLNGSSVVHNLSYSGSNPRFCDVPQKTPITCAAGGTTSASSWTVTARPAYC